MHSYSYIHVCVERKKRGPEKQEGRIAKTPEMIPFRIYDSGPVNIMVLNGRLEPPYREYIYSDFSTLDLYRSGSSLSIRGPQRPSLMAYTAFYIY